jgi:hypothetical protein
MARAVNVKGPARTIYALLRDAQMRSASCKQYRWRAGGFFLARAARAHVRNVP